MEQPPLEQWDLVIKVKYGDTLRRIGVYVHGQHMDHNMSKLRAKIISLFKFSHDADLILTYTDEDGDVVTLDDDHDLRDAVIGQHLNPLRINVQLKPIPPSSNVSSETSSIANAPQPETLSTVGKPPNSVPVCTRVVTQPFGIAQKVVSPSHVDEVMKSKPFRSEIGDLSKDVQEFPALSPIIEQFSKLEFSNEGQTSGPTGESALLSHESSSRLMDLNVVNDLMASCGRIMEGTELPICTAGSHSVNSSPEQNEARIMVQDGNDAGHATLYSTDINVGAPKSSLCPTDNLLAPTGSAYMHLEHWKEVGGPFREGKFLSPENLSLMQPLPDFTNGCADVMHGCSCNKQSLMGTRVPSPFLPAFNSYSEVPIGAPPSGILQPTIPMAHNYQQSFIYNENAQQTCRRGVQCDVSGMHPIAGPRFKSNVKENYDLCNCCFTKIGNEHDYTIIDHASGLLDEFDNQLFGCQLPLSKSSLYDFDKRAPNTKLESRFILDVTVLDGTILPPSDRFTKIWRMHNNGTVAWPFGTQLVWDGGDQFGNKKLTDLEIPANGFPVNAELDIAVDLTTPSSPGCYVSYWRMVSPTGQKFGQRVWVLIQVDCTLPKFSPAADIGSFQRNFNLNMPPESSDRYASGIIDINADPFNNDFTEANATWREEKNAPSAPISDNISEYSPKAANSLSVSPLIDLPAPSPMVDMVPVVAEAASDDNAVEEALLKELEAMGFKQNDLNKEILRRNEYDLEQTVDDLCDYAEWGPILSELHEMSTPPEENIRHATTTTVTKWRKIKRVSWK